MLKITSAVAESALSFLWLCVEYLYTLENKLVFINAQTWASRNS